MNVVDDDPVIRQLLLAVLGSGVYRVEAAPAGGVQPTHLAEAGADELMSLRTVLPGA